MSYFDEVAKEAINKASSRPDKEAIFNQFLKDAEPESTKLIREFATAAVESIPRVPDLAVSANGFKEQSYYDCDRRGRVKEVETIRRIIVLRRFDGSDCVILDCKGTFYNTRLFADPGQNLYAMCAGSLDARDVLNIFAGVYKDMGNPLNIPSFLSCLKSHLARILKDNIEYAGTTQGSGEKMNCGQKAIRDYL